MLYVPISTPFFFCKDLTSLWTVSDILPLRVLLLTLWTSWVGIGMCIFLIFNLTSLNYLEWYLENNESYIFLPLSSSFDMPSVWGETSCNHLLSIHSHPWPLITILLQYRFSPLLLNHSSSLLTWPSPFQHPLHPSMWSINTTLLLPHKNQQ